MSRLRIFISLICGCIYVASLFPNVFIFSARDNFSPGYICLIAGMGFLAWYANILLLVSHAAMHIRKDRAALALAVAALGFACTTLWIKRLPADEAARNMVDVTGYGTGFYLWMASIVTTIMLQTLFLWRKSGTHAKSL